MRNRMHSLLQKLLSPYIVILISGTSNNDLLHVPGTTINICLEKENTVLFLCINIEQCSIVFFLQRKQAFVGSLFISVVGILSNVILNPIIYIIKKEKRSQREFLPIIAANRSRAIPGSQIGS